MPNIIEQQDLLKGLPDNRLAMMMQNPTGDIPPFLVAAEAQRRQAIRAQFSGGPEESVVDTLTKQMANVPQNIQAPAQTPPQLPPPMPPQMGGVAALQQQMPEQQMRRGGVVQRYDTGSLVTPSYRGRAGAGGYLPGEEPDSSSILGDIYDAVVNSTFTQRLGEYGVNPSAEKTAELAEEVKKAAAPAPKPISAGMSYTPRIQTASPVQEPRDPEAGKEDSSLENMQMTSAEYEKRLRSILGASAEDSEDAKNKIREFYTDEGASDWEKAQKWFAAAQAAIQPGQNNWQATINAISAFGGGMADERAAERESQKAMEEALFKFELADLEDRSQREREIAKGLLEFDVAEIERQRAQAAAAREEKLAAYKLYSEGAGSSIDAANQSIKSLITERKEYIDSLPKDELTGEPKIDPNDPVLRGYDEQIKTYRDMIAGAMGQRGKALAGYGAMTGTNPSVEVFTGEGLATYNR